MTRPQIAPSETDSGKSTPQQGTYTELWAAFIRWILCGVALALLPVAMNWISLLSWLRRLTCGSTRKWRAASDQCRARRDGNW